jgi:hypothetical protein
LQKSPSISSSQFFLAIPKFLQQIMAQQEKVVYAKKDSEQTSQLGDPRNAGDSGPTRWL